MENILQIFFNKIEAYVDMDHTPTPWYWTEESIKLFKLTTLRRFTVRVLDNDCEISFLLMLFYYFKFPLDNEGRYLSDSDFDKFMVMFSPYEDHKPMIEYRRKIPHIFGEEYKMSAEEYSPSNAHALFENKFEQMVIYLATRDFDIFKNVMAMTPIGVSPNKKFTEQQTMGFDEFYATYISSFHDRREFMLYEDELKMVAANLQEFKDEILGLFELNGDDPVRQAAKILGSIGATLYSNFGMLHFKYAKMEYTFRGPVVTIEDLYLLFFMIKRWIRGIVIEGNVCELNSFQECGHKWIADFVHPGTYDHLTVFLAWFFFE